MALALSRDGWASSVESCDGHTPPLVIFIGILGLSSFVLTLSPSTCYRNVVRLLMRAQHILVIPPVPSHVSDRQVPGYQTLISAARAVASFSRKEVPCLRTKRPLHRASRGPRYLYAANPLFPGTGPCFGSKTGLCDCITRAPYRLHVAGEKRKELQESG